MPYSITSSSRSIPPASLLFLQYSLNLLYIPFLSGIFNTVALNLGQWLLVIFFSGIIFLINSVYLLIKSKK